jgi:hypothetical protein
MKSKLRSCFFLLILLIVSSNNLHAQIDTVRLNKYYFKKYWTDTKQIVSSPARWHQNDWIKFGAIVSFTAGLTLVDQPVADFFQSRQDKNLDYASANIFEHFGAEHSVWVMSGIYTYGWLAQNNRSKSTALLALESFVLASLVTRVPKLLAGRQRPDNWQGYGPYQFEGPFRGVSFPSGHTTASFAVASVIATQYRDHKWIPITAYSVAALAGLSRIYDNRHWVSDVFMGAVIGTTVGNLVSHRVPHSKLTVIPFRTDGFQGLKLAYKL